MKKIEFNGKKVSLGYFAILSVVGFSTIALLVSSSILIWRFNSSIQKTAVTTTEQLAGQVERTIDSYIETMVKSMQDIELIAKSEGNAKELNERLDVLFNLQNDLVAIVIYDKFGDILNCTSGKESLLKSDTTANLSYKYKGTSMEGGYDISPPHVNNLFVGKYQWVVTISKEIYSTVYGQPVKVAMDVGFSSIASYIDNVRIGENGYCYIVNQNSDIVYHPKQQLIYKGLEKEDTRFIMDKADGTYVTKNSIYAIKPTGNADWTIVGVSFVDELILNKRNEALVFSLVIFLFSIVVFVIVGILISKGFTKPAKKLIHSMTEFENGVSNFEHNPIQGFSEIQDLDASFRDMVTKIQELMEHIKYEEEVLRKVEFNALQEQINPHFLYNTLDSILWMSEKGQNKEVSKMVSALAKLFRISLSKGKEIILIEHEFKHVESYLIIQSIRYKDQFTYEFIIEDGILDSRCLKISLQPFVENAIYHGIDRMVDEGKITISVSVTISFYR
ncbi:MAG: histidine kinase [Oscillospiraceae bacterium]